MKPKAFSYIRFSTPEQRKGHSLERQLQKARAYALSKGWELDETLTFRDEGVSAYQGDNFATGRLAAFVEACDNGKVPRGSYLLVENLDRLSRQKTRQAIRQFEAILERGVSIVTLTDGNIYGPDALDDFSTLIMAVLTMQRAYEESATKAARLAAAWEAKRRRASEGKAMTSMCPGWLKKVGTRYELIEDHAQIVRQIFELALEGYGKGQIAKLLNERDVPPFGRGAGWHPSSVQKILENEATIGISQPHRVRRSDLGIRTREPVGEPVRDYFPAVISEDIFYRVRAARAERRIPTGPKGIRLSNLFTGLGKCAHCGGPMHFDNKGGGYTRLTCGDAKRRPMDHPANSWSYPLAERFTLLALRDLLEVQQTLPVAPANAYREAVIDLEGKLAAARGRKAQTDEAIAKLLSAIEQGGPAETINARLRERGEEATTVETDIARLEEALVVARAAVEENKRDRQGTEEALKHWAECSAVEDTAEAYRVRLAMQQLLKRTVASLTFERSDGEEGDYGQIAVTLKGGVGVHLLVSQVNEDWEMRARAYRFAAEDARGVSEMTRWEYLEVPDWWPAG